VVSPSPAVIRSVEKIEPARAQLINESCSSTAGQELPERWLGGARSERPARGTDAVYGVSKESCESVAGGSDGAVVAAAPLCANSHAFVLYRAMR
jgi:hypothetical protein